MIICIPIKLDLPRTAIWGEFVWGVARAEVQASRNFSNEAGMDLWALLTFTSPSLKEISNCHISEPTLSYTLLPAKMAGLYAFFFVLTSPATHGDKWGSYQQQKHPVAHCSKPGKGSLISQRIVHSLQFW